MHIVITRFRLAMGVDSGSLIAASRAVHERFEVHHEGMMSRMLCCAPDGTYADIDQFASEEAMVGVMAAAEADPACATYFGMMELIGEPESFEVVDS